MVCASRVDEDVDAPNDADYIRSVFDPDQADLLFEFSDAPPNLGVITEIEVRFRAYKEGTGDATALVGIAHAGLGGLVGTPAPFPITGSPAEYSYTISGTVLLPTEVDGLLTWIRANVAGSAPDTRVIVTAMNDKPSSRQSLQIHR